MSLAHVLSKTLAARGALTVDPAVLQPAHLYFELAGEDLRKRAFLVPEADGSDLCLRPDMTIPVCREALTRIEWRANAPFVLSYEGQVFRRRTDTTSGAAEFMQAGAEWFFPVSTATALEPEIIAAAIEGARAESVEPQLKLGDVSVFRALVEAAELPAPWGARLIRAFARPGGAAAVLKEAANPPQVKVPELAFALVGETPERAEEKVAETLAAANIPLTGGRSFAEIAARLQNQALRAAAPKPDPQRVNVIAEALSIEGGPEEVLAGIAYLSQQDMSSLGLDAALEAAAVRWQNLRSLVRAPEQTRFSLSLGRGLAYYDGFVFELDAPALGPRAQLGGGGRYDGLIHALARREENAPNVSGWGAAGFALRTKRLADAAERKP